MSQEAVFDFLASGAASGGTRPRRIDTHAASVFLFPDRALKVKRAVRLPFLDYSTLALRRAACEAELAVNRRFAPQLYRGLVAITRGQDGRLALGGEGEPVEWAVEMVRFDETQTLDHLAEAGRIDAALADALGRAVAQAHAQAPPAAAAPWIEALGGMIDEHRDAFAASPDLFPPPAAAGFDTRSRTAYARIRPLLETRGAAGLVRRCHGDLHLGNIVLIEGAPVLFDAIEFSELIATGDVLYDLAFLLMDLNGRGLSLAANIVFNRYLAETRREADLPALAALPFYLATRAAIRAKVAALRGARADAAQSVAAEARHYFAHACTLIAPPPPVLVGIGGLSGTGKSALARMLAPSLGAVPGAVLLRSDVERKQLCGVAETERLPASAYAPEVTARVYAGLMHKAALAVGAGHAAIVDAVFARAEERAALATVAARSQVRFRGVFLTAPLHLRQERVGRRRGDASDADAAVAALQESYDLGALDWTTVDASGTPEDSLHRARAALGLGR